MYIGYIYTVQCVFVCVLKRFPLAVLTDKLSVISCALVSRYSRGVMSPGRHVRTRLYFTSESHVHSLLSVFRYGGLLDVRSHLIVSDNFVFHSLMALSFSVCR